MKPYDTESLVDDDGAFAGVMLVLFVALVALSVAEMLGAGMV